MPTWTIRRAKAADAKSLAACIDAAYSIYSAQGIDLPAVSDGIAEEIRSNLVWVAVLDQQIIGGLILVPRDDHAMLANVAVDPAAAGKGLGRALVERAELAARELGIGKLRLNTHRDITNNVRLYEHLGWCVTGRVGDKVQMEKIIAG